jgi:hypothetical protein
MPDNSHLGFNPIYNPTEGLVTSLINPLLGNQSFTLTQSLLFNHYINTRINAKI